MPGSGNTTVPASVDELAFLEFSTLAELLLGRQDLEALPDPRLVRYGQQLPGRFIGCGPLKGTGVSRRPPSLPPPADDTDRNPALEADDVDADLLPPPREAIVEALEKSGGNQSKAARAMKMDRYRFKRLMDAYGIKRPE